MAVHVVIALFYYLQWTAKLFAPAPETAPETAPAVAAGTLRTPAPLAAALALTACGAVVLSVVPQLVLQVVDGTLF